MSINSVNYNLNNSYGAYVQKLSSETKRKLIELNIPFTNSTTEEEAQSLIRSALAKKQTDNLSDKKSQNSKSSPNDILERARKLAKQLGINYDDKINCEQLLSMIQTSLDARIQASQNNIGELEQLKKFSNELSSLQAQLSGSMNYEDKNQMLLKSLEVLSQYNKNFLNQ